MVVDHTRHIGFPPCNRGIHVVCPPRNDTRRTRSKFFNRATTPPEGSDFSANGPRANKSSLATVKSAKQLPNASDQSLNRERFHQVLDVVLGQEKGDSCIGGEPGNENEAIGQ